MNDYDLAFKEALKTMSRNFVKNQTRFVTQTIKHFVTSEEVKEIGIALSVEMLIKSTKQIIEDIGTKESTKEPIFYMVNKYLALESVNSLGNGIVELYEQNKAASVEEICKGIEDIAAKMQSEEYLDNKITKFIEGVKVDKG